MLTDFLLAITEYYSKNITGSLGFLICCFYMLLYEINLLLIQTPEERSLWNIHIIISVLEISDRFSVDSPSRRLNSLIHQEICSRDLKITAV